MMATMDMRIVERPNTIATIASSDRDAVIECHRLNLESIKVIGLTHDRVYNNYGL